MTRPTHPGSAYAKDARCAGGADLRPPDIAGSGRWWARTSNGESVGANAVMHVGGDSAFLAVPLRNPRGAIAAIVDDFDVGLVRQRALESEVQSFVCGIDDEKLARHGSHPVVHVVRHQPMSCYVTGTATVRPDRPSSAE
jgi:hypothetical protein